MRWCACVFTKGHFFNGKYYKATIKKEVQSIQYKRSETGSATKWELPLCLPVRLVQGDEITQGKAVQKQFCGSGINLTKYCVRYHLCQLTFDQEQKTFLAELGIQASVSDLDGAPRKVQILYELRDNGIHQSILWFDKDATRLPEAVFSRMYFKTACSDIRVKKISETVNVMDIVENGNRKLMAVEQVAFDIETIKVTIKNIHSPLFAPGAGEILKYDNRFENIAKDGFSFNLFNNIWETNFQLWYSENALFEYEICFDEVVKEIRD